MEGNVRVPPGKRQPHWRQVAQQLAIQLSAHAFCEQHPVSDPDGECPYCADRDAYQVWLNAGGRDYRPASPPGARSVPLHEIPQQDAGPLPRLEGDTLFYNWRDKRP
jgi:hypothetical protein